MEHRLRVDLPSDLPAEKVEEFAATVASDLSPDMSGTFGAIHVGGAGGGRDVWTALGWQHDGSSVYLRIDPPQGSVELHLDTHALQRPIRHGRWARRLLLAILLACPVAGILARSWLLAVGLLIATLTGWVVADALRQRARERQRTIDPAAWERRLQAAVDHAKGGRSHP